MATLNIRGIDGTAAKEIKLAAAAHDMRIGEYVAVLHALHRHLVNIADWDDLIERRPDSRLAQIRQGSKWAKFSVKPSTREFLQAVGLPIIYT